MLKKSKSLLSALMALMLLLGSIPLSAAAEEAEEAAAQSSVSAAALQQADTAQVEQVFESLSEWKNYLIQKNETHQESDLSHQSIQQVLK